MRKRKAIGQIVSATNGKWRPIEVDEAQHDKEFQFLALFEEFQPETPPTKKKRSLATIPTLSNSVDTSLVKSNKIKVKELKKGKKLGADDQIKPRKSSTLKNDKQTKLNTTETDLHDVVVVEKGSVGKSNSKIRFGWSKSADAVADISGSKIVCDAWRQFKLPKPILQAIADLQFNEPTKIQKAVLPVALDQKLDIVGAAETGSGKTLAYALPVITHLINDGDINDLSTLILTPTRELAIQVRDHILALVKYTNLKVVSVIGGLSIDKQRRVLLKSKPNIIVCTPGRLWELIDENSNFADKLRAISYLIIDETDRMVEKGHFEELTKIVDLINENVESRSKRQNFVFSATLTFIHALPVRLTAGKKTSMEKPNLELKIKQLCKVLHMRKSKKIIDVTRKFGITDTLTEARVNCDSVEEKDLYLYYFLLKHPGRSLVFCNSINTTRRLFNLLTMLKIDNLFLLHAKMVQKQRLKNLERFASTTKSVLLATDVAARGLDIKNVEHVIHYHLPRATETYVHRSGRTARASQLGLSVMLVDATEVMFYQRIISNLNQNTHLPVFPMVEEYVDRIKPRLALAREIEKFSHRLSKNRQQRSWFEKNAVEADVEFDAQDAQNSGISRVNTDRLSEEIKSLQNELWHMLKSTSDLSKPGHVTKYPSYAGGVAKEQSKMELSTIEQVNNQPVLKAFVRGFKVNEKKNKKRQQRSKKNR